MKKLLLLLLFASCSVKYSYLKPGYESNERLTLKRIGIFTEKTQDKNISLLFSDLSKEYISHHKEYILKPASGNSCSKELNGILVNKFDKLHLANGKLELHISSRLYSCPQKELIWETRAEKSFSVPSSSLQSAVKSYSEKYGTEVADYVYPFYNIVRVVMGKLPSPKLGEDDIMEKIDSEGF